jgi:hypothetical protein
MRMIVRFTKARHAERPPTFTCIRDDGTRTGMPSTGFFVRHDLTHYAVEVCLGLKEAFYGLLASGWDIDSFIERQPDSRKVRAMPMETGLAEAVVGTLDLDWAAGPLPASQSADIIRQKFSEFGAIEAAPTEEKIDQIRQARSELLQRWSALEPGESLELVFPAIIRQSGT